jgi:Protein of unknown function (DUF2975)
MNANEISSEAKSTTNSKSSRVVKISRTLKAMLLVYFFILPLFVIVTSRKGMIWNFSGQVYSNFSGIPVSGKVICVLSVSIDLMALIVFYRLLNLYEKGIFFSSQNVRLFRALGYLAFSEGLIDVISPVVSSGLINFPSFLFSVLGSPWIVGGLFGIMISFIMDEGCKMREEQELTV